MKIAETYIHLTIDTSSEFRDAAKSYLYSRANTLSKEIIGKEVELSVRVEGGSFIAWATIFGILTFTALTKYGSLRSGIDYLVKDIRKFSQVVIDNFLHESNISEEDVYRLERRLGVPGKIQRLFKKIDRFERENHPETSNEIKNEADKLKKEILKILEQIQEDIDRKMFLHSLPELIRNELPQQLPEPSLSISASKVRRAEEEESSSLPKEKGQLPPPK